MSHQGNLTFFVPGEFLVSKDLVNVVFDYFEAQKAYTAFITRGIDREWDQFRNSLRAEVLPHRQKTATIQDTEAVIVGENISLSAVIEHLPKNGEHLTIDLNAREFSKEIYNLINESIAESIRGLFTPCGVRIEIGGHDIFEYAENPNGHLYGRSEFSVSIYSDFSPNDWKEYRELIFRVPKIIMLKKDLEEIIRSPLKKCIYWIL